MNLKKSVLAASLLSATFSGQVLANEAVTVYGKLNISAQHNEEAGEGNTEIKSNASRLGVKGDYQVHDQLTAFYKIEYEVDTSSSSKENFKARNQYVGLKGQFGEVSVGRNDTMLKKSQGKVDLFSDFNGDIKNTGFEGENRLEQTATYQTPSIGLFSAGVTFATDANSKQGDKNGMSVAAMYGDAKLKKSAFYAAIAYDSQIDQHDTLRATAQAKVGLLTVGGIYQQQEGIAAGSDSESGYLVSVKYALSKQIDLKTQYQSMEQGSDDINSWSLGADYKLAKPTKLYAFYTNTDEADDSNNYLAVGISHSF